VDPQWTGIESQLLANVLAFGAALRDGRVAWLIERWCCASSSTRKASRC
jgi:hypothetical protein